MIIQVKPRDAGDARSYSYNAPTSIRVGDLVELPPGAGPNTWVGEVIAAGTLAHARLVNSGYAGPIKAIVGRTPLKVTVEASTRDALRQKLLDAIDDIDGEGDVFYHADGSER